MVMGLAKKLKDDSTVKPKKRSMMDRLFKHMKDCRNIINLIATVNVLEIISDYQKWGQLEKASVFERKFAVARLKQKLKCLKETHKAKKTIDDHINFIDLVEKKVTVGNLDVKIGWLPNSKTALIMKVVARQQKMGNDFMSLKLILHGKEDPKFLSDLSEVFDLRL